MSDQSDFDPTMAMYLLFAKRILAAARILHDSLALQRPEEAMMASLDLMGGVNALMDQMSTYLTEKTLLEEGDELMEQDDDYLINKYNDLLLEASNGDPMVMLGEAFEEQVKLLNAYFQ